MKLKNTILYIAALSLFSCEMKNEILDGNKNYEDVGYLNLGVYAQNKLSKAATNEGVSTNSPVSVDNFNVEISNSEGVFKEFDSYSELQAAGKIELPVGNYTVKAHTPGDIQPKMDSPYYYGETALEIVKGVEKTATVNCKMKNTKIQLKYGETFATVFKSWKITVSDGSSNILTYDQSNPNPSAVYWLIADNVSEITVHIEACLQDGTQITEDRSITKPEDAESDYWAGSDALTITMEPGKPENPSGVTIDIKVEVSFTDSEVTEEIPVEPGDDPILPPGGGDEEGAPTITFPKNYYTLPDDEDESADANIIASSGLKSVIVKITAGNSAFEDALSMLPMAGETEDEKAMLDLISGAELVGNELLPQVIKLALSGVNIPELNKGAGHYEFPVGDFFTALKSLGSTGTDGKPSSHMFEITVEDMSGKSASGVLNVSVK